MPKPKNEVFLEGSNLKIKDNWKSFRFFNYFVYAIVGYQGITTLLEFQQTRDVWDLVFGVLLVAGVSIALIRELFFLDFSNEIKIREINSIKIQKWIWGNAFVRMKLKNKTRELQLNYKEAQSLKAEFLSQKKGSRARL